MTTLADLRQPLQTWTRRLRIQRAITWSLRGFIAGLGVALIVGLIGLFLERILRERFLTLVFSSALISPILFGFIAALWQIPPLKAARHFDILFHLNERISTALELDQHPEHIPPEIIHRQLTDAVTTARTVNLRREFPLRISSRESLTAVLLIALISLAWLKGDSRFQAAQQAHNVQQAVEEQVNQIEEIIQQIESNPELTDEQKEALTQPLKEAQQSLQDNPSLENSVSALTTAGEKLQELADPQAQQITEALHEAGNQLANQEGSPLENVGENLANGDVVNAATDLGNIDVSQLSAEEQQQLAEQLQSLADSVASTNPELADQLNQAAEALQNGDTQTAQQALNQAAQSLAQTGQQLSQSQVANQTASQLQQGADQVIAAGGNGQQQQANNQGSQGQGNNGQGSNGQGNNGQGSNQGGQNSGNNGSGSGSGTGSGTSSNGTEAGTDPINQNAQSDGGESAYEQIYAPQLLGGEGGDQVTLPSTDPNSGEVIGQGPTTPGNPGTSTVPYNEVYGQYEQANNQAIENGDVPTQFIQIIKNYFNSLKP